MASRRARSPSQIGLAGNLLSLRHPNPDIYIFRLTKGPEVLSITIADTADDGRGFGTIKALGPFSASEYEDDHGTLLGDGVNTIFDVAHGFGTKAVEVWLTKVSNDEHATVGWIALSVTTVRLEFRTAPTTDEFQVYIRAIRPPA